MFSWRQCLEAIHCSDGAAGAVGVAGSVAEGCASECSQRERSTRCARCGKAGWCACPAAGWRWCYGSVASQRGPQRCGKAVWCRFGHLGWCSGLPSTQSMCARFLPAFRLIRATTAPPHSTPTHPNPPQPTRPHPPQPAPAGYALGPRRSRIGSALSRLTPAGRRRRSSAAGSAAGSGALSPAGTGAGAGPQGASQAGLSAGLGIVGSGKLASCEVEDGAEAPLAVPLGSSGAAAAAAARAAGGPAANGAAKGVSLHGQLSADGRLLQLPGSAALGDQLPPSPFESEATSSGPVLPPSPFEVPSPAAAAVAAVAGASQHALLRGSAAASGGGASVMRSQRPTAQLPGNGRLMLYQRSMLRLRSSVAGALSGGGAAAGQRHGQRLAALEEGRAAQEDGAGATEGEDGGAPAEPETVLEPAGSGSKGGSDGQAAAAPKNGFSWDDKAVRVTSR